MSFILFLKIVCENMKLYPTGRKLSVFRPARGNFDKLVGVGSLALLELGEVRTVQFL